MKEHSVTDNQTIQIYVIPREGVERPIIAVKKLTGEAFSDPERGS